MIQRLYFQSHRAAKQGLSLNNACKFRLFEICGPLLYLEETSTAQYIKISDESHS